MIFCLYVSIIFVPVFDIWNAIQSHVSRWKEEGKKCQVRRTPSQANNRVNMRHWNGFAFTTFLQVVMACACVYVIVSNEQNTFWYIKMNATSNVAINKKKSQQHTCSTIQQIAWVNSRSNTDTRSRARARARGKGICRNWQRFDCVAWLNCN